MKMFKRIGAAAPASDMMMWEERLSQDWDLGSVFPSPRKTITRQSLGAELTWPTGKHVANASCPSPDLTAVAA